MARMTQTYLSADRQTERSAGAAKSKKPPAVGRPGASLQGTEPLGSGSFNQRGWLGFVSRKRLLKVAK